MKQNVFFNPLFVIIFSIYNHSHVYSLIFILSYTLALENPKSILFYPLAQFWMAFIDWQKSNLGFKIQNQRNVLLDSILAFTCIAFWLIKKKRKRPNDLMT